jgi:hypothetical protein
MLKRPEKFLRRGSHDEDRQGADLWRPAEEYKREGHSLTRSLSGDWRLAISHCPRGQSYD